MKQIGLVIIVLGCLLLSAILVGAQQSGSPCDAVIQYMRAGAGLIRNIQEPDKDKALADLKKQYEEKMRGAPAKAIKLAEVYVNKLKKGWEKAGDNTVFEIIEARDAALKACGRNPEQAGF